MISTTRTKSASVSRRRHPRLMPVLPWVGIAVAMVGLGLAIGAWLESGLLGFIGADFVFLLALAVYTTVHDGAHSGRH